MNLIFLGAPGSGKGTIAEMLAKGNRFKHISTGDLLRKEISENTALGKQVKKIINAGKLVSDELINGLMKKYAGDNIIYDGYPRTISQAKALDAFARVDFAILFELSEGEIIKRLSGRRICPAGNEVYHVDNIPPKVPGICDRHGEKLIQRKDDTPEVIRQRFEEFHGKTAPLIEHYKKKGILKKVGGKGTPKEVYDKLLKIIMANKK